MRHVYRCAILEPAKNRSYDKTQNNQQTENDKKCNDFTAKCAVGTDENEIHITLAVSIVADIKTMRMLCVP